LRVLRARVLAPNVMSDGLGARKTRPRRPEPARHGCAADPVDLSLLRRARFALPYGNFHEAGVGASEECVEKNLHFR
jgi:hypothetical protein